MYSLTFETIGNFFKGLELYTEVSPTATMSETIKNIMIEVLGSDHPCDSPSRRSNRGD